MRKLRGKITIDEQDGRRTVWLNGINITKYVRSVKVSVEHNAATEVVLWVPELVVNSDLADILVEEKE